MTETAVKTEHFDVLVVGAGISGVGAAYHLTHQRPDTSFVVLENQETFGGTWITHKYPGIRSGAPQVVPPAVSFTTTSSTYHFDFEYANNYRSRFLRISNANIGPKRFHQ